MNEQELAVKLTEVDERGRSNTKRIDKLEQRQDDLDKLVTSVELLAMKQEAVEGDVKEIKTDVKKLSEVPAKRWEKVVDLVLGAVAGAFVAWLIAGGAI